MAYINPGTGDRFEDWEVEELAEQQIDDIYGTVTIAGCTYGTAYALKEVDPIAYQDTINSLIDSMEFVHE